MAARPRKPNPYALYRYLDYRTFARDRFTELKAREVGFTVREFSAKAGFGSPSYLKMVVDGQRDLTPESAKHFAMALGLKNSEINYFLELVEYTQCRDPDLKRSFYEKLEELRPSKAFTPLERKQLKYLTKDYYACIREMVLLPDFRDNAKWIAARCVPRISPNQAREALKTLLAINLLKRDTSGKLVQVNTIVGTQSQAREAETFHFHEAMLTKARRCLALVPQEERNFLALIVPMSQKLASSASERFQRLLDEVLAEANREGEEFTEVFQINFQFFPVTRKREDATEESSDEN